MLTVTPRGSSDAARFALRAVAASLGFFGLLRLSWTEAHILLPLTRAQAAVAAGLFGPSALPVEVTLACSGADALALCFGAILAYPVAWRRRLAGAGGGAALILALNTVRIGTLAQAAASPAWFNTLHLYLWPAVLTLAIAAHVFAWMQVADRRQTAVEHPLAVGTIPSQRPHLTGRFAWLTAAFVVLFAAASPLYLESAAVLALATVVASSAAAALGLFDASAHNVANVLWTRRGGFLVTQECIATPLLPVYLAATCAYSTTWRRLILGLFATVPLFAALGIARLLVVALPDALVASPAFFIHAFYQLLLGTLVVIVAAHWRHSAGAASRHAVAGLVVGVAFVHFLGPSYTRMITYPTGAPLDDPQGAIALLPAFQVGFYLALWIAAFVIVGWRRFLAGLAMLELTQMAGLLALQVLASHSGLTANVRDVRGWAVAGPLLIVAVVVNIARPRP